MLKCLTGYLFIGEHEYHCLGQIYIREQFLLVGLWGAGEKEGIG